MDEATKDFIRRNLVRLTEATNCNTPLLLRLCADNVLTGNEMDTIKALNTKLEKSTEFYCNILPIKSQECYNRTIHALSSQAVGQIPAANILMELNDQQALLNTLNGSRGESTVSSVSIMQTMGDGVHVNIERLLAIFREVGDRKFILLSINGKMRHGKSFMMSCILSYLRSNQSAAWMQQMIAGSTEFKWKMGRDAETKGINIWPHPIIIKDANDEDVAVLLMDCQGAFDDETSTHQNSLIFAMSTLLSSVLIFNVLGRVTEADIHPFLVFMQTALQANEENRNSKPFQSLILLNRDFQSVSGQFNYGFYTETTTPGNCSRNLFRETFHPQSNVNEIRNAREPILNNFKDLGIFALPYPGEAIRSDNISNLNADFVEKTTEFMRLLFSKENLMLKRIGGESPVTGNDYVPYCKALGEIFNRNTIPHVKSFFDSITDGQLTLAKDNVMAEFNNKMREFTSANAEGTSTHDLYQHYKNVIHTETLQDFSKRSVVGSVEKRARFEHLLQLEMEVAHQMFQVAEANKRLAALNSSAPKYWYNKEIVTKTRNRFMGIVVSPTTTISHVRTFNDALYNSDAALVKSEIATANANLETAQLALRTSNLSFQ